MAKDIPVYVFTGFMDSGKTTLIQETLFENDFAAGGEDRILILACEDGDVEYDIEKLKTINAKVVMIESEDEFNLDNLSKISKEYNPDVLIQKYIILLVVQFVVEKQILIQQLYQWVYHIALDKQH